MNSEYQTPHPDPLKGSQESLENERALKAYYICDKEKQALSITKRLSNTYWQCFSNFRLSKTNGMLQILVSKTIYW